MTCEHENYETLDAEDTEWQWCLDCGALRELEGRRPATEQTVYVTELYIWGEWKVPAHAKVTT